MVVCGWCNGMNHWATSDLCLMCTTPTDTHTHLVTHGPNQARYFCNACHSNKDSIHLYAGHVHHHFHYSTMQWPQWKKHRPWVCGSQLGTWLTVLSRYLSRKSSRKDLPFLKAPATDRTTTFLSLTSSDNSISWAQNMSGWREQHNIEHSKLDICSQ